MSFMGGQGVMSGSGRMGNKIPKGYKSGQMQQFTPEQMGLFQQMFGHLGPNSYLSKLAGGDEGMFNQMEAPAFRQFNELQGNTASRFSGAGSMGSRRSSGFQNTIGQMGSDFAQDLQSRRQSMQQQAIQELMGLSGSLLGQRPYDQFMVEKQQKQPSGWGGVIGAGVGGLGGMLAGKGNPMMGLRGAQLGYNVGSGF